VSDNIELPPLPATHLRFEVSVTPRGERLDYTAEDMKAYARAAILADRARQAPAPVEVSRLKDELQQKIEKYVDDCIADAATHRPYTGNAWAECTATIDRLAAAASTPVGEVPAGHDLDIAAQGVQSLLDSLMPSFEYVGVSLRVSAEDHAAIRSAMAGARTSLQLIRNAIAASARAQSSSKGS
jgi:hypothetical protein